MPLRYSHAPCGRGSGSGCNSDTQSAEGEGSTLHKLILSQTFFRYKLLYIIDFKPGLNDNYLRRFITLSKEMDMKVSPISESRRNMFIEYANRYMSFKAGNESEEPVTKPENEPIKKTDKSMGIETLTIFPKQVINGKTIITA